MSRIVTAKEYMYFELRQAVDELTKRYGFLRSYSVGKSVLGKDIVALSIGRGSEPILLCGAFHGAERLTATLLLMFAERLSNAVLNDGHMAGIRAGRAFFDRKIVIIPMVNPDGCDIVGEGSKNCGGFKESVNNLSAGRFEKWSANVRGVDINHNFNAGWKELRRLEQKLGIFGPSPSRYGGPYPESEPETAALVNLCLREPFCHVAAFHSQGEVIYWNYQQKQGGRAKRMASLLSASSGYALDEPTEIASYGGFKDWFIEKYRRPGFTIEIGKGQNPLPVSQIDPIYARLEEMVMLLCIL